MFIDACMYVCTHEIYSYICSSARLPTSDYMSHNSLLSLRRLSKCLRHCDCGVKTFVNNRALPLKYGQLKS